MVTLHLFQLCHLLFYNRRWEYEVFIVEDGNMKVFIAEDGNMKYL